jgi:hypothetical protein
MLALGTIRPAKSGHDDSLIRAIFLVRAMWGTKAENRKAPLNQSRRLRHRDGT